MQRYFDEISQDTGKYCFMVEDTLKGLELGAVETLIVWEGLETQRCVRVSRASVAPGLGSVGPQPPPYVNATFSSSRNNQVHGPRHVDGGGVGAAREQGAGAGRVGLAPAGPQDGPRAGGGGQGACVRAWIRVVGVGVRVRVWL